MKKQIVIIGGGISGLTLLHYLKKKYAREPDVEIALLEKDFQPGGTVQTIFKNGVFFEQGPNGFLGIKPTTLEFINDLQLSKSLIHAEDAAKIRCLSIRNKLYPIPTSPFKMMTSSLLSPADKVRICREPSVKAGTDPKETVHDFGLRRFGERFTNRFLDPLVAGVYGGEAKKLCLKAAFPWIYAMEQEHGSLLKALKKSRHKSRTKGSTDGSPVGSLMSFEKGMAQLTDVLKVRYADAIFLHADVQDIRFEEGRYFIRADTEYAADQVFFSVPAYRAGQILANAAPRLSEALAKIHYSSIAVIGLVYRTKDFEKLPKGFGYLVPSFERKPVLGVLFESQIFPQRTHPTQQLFRVMIGGVRNPRLLEQSDADLINIAKMEILATLKCQARPHEVFVSRWPKAIPQYDLDYVNALDIIVEELKRLPNLKLVANYVGGVSFNDCIENAKQAADHSKLA